MISTMAPKKGAFGLIETESFFKQGSMWGVKREEIRQAWYAPCSIDLWKGSSRPLGRSED